MDNALPDKDNDARMTRAFVREMRAGDGGLVRKRDFRITALSDNGPFWQAFGECCDDKTPVVFDPSSLRQPGRTVNVGPIELPAPCEGTKPRIGATWYGIVSNTCGHGRANVSDCVAAGVLTEMMRVAHTAPTMTNFETEKTAFRAASASDDDTAFLCSRVLRGDARIVLDDPPRVDTLRSRMEVVALLGVYIGSGWPYERCATLARHDNGDIQCAYAPWATDAVSAQLRAVNDLRGIR